MFPDPLLATQLFCRLSFRLLSPYWGKTKKSRSPCVYFLLLLRGVPFFRRSASRVECVSSRLGSCFETRSWLSPNGELQEPRLHCALDLGVVWRSRFQAHLGPPNGNGPQDMPNEVLHKPLNGNCWSLGKLEKLNYARM